MLFYHPKMLFDDILSFTVFGSNWSTNLMAFDRFLSHNVSSDTDVARTNYYRGLELAQDNVIRF